MSVKKEKEEKKKKDRRDVQMLRLTDNRGALVIEFTEVTDNPRVHSGHSIVYSLNKLLIFFFVVTFLRRINLAKEKEKE